MPPNEAIKLDFDLPTSYPKLEETFGKFDWHDLENTWGADIALDPKWAAKNIVAIELPGILPRRVWIHRKISKIFKACVLEAKVRRPDYVITSCASFAPRHKLHRIDRPLSLHSWAIAFDINPRMNPYGAFIPLAKKPLDDTKKRLVNIYYDLPEEFIAVFEAAGFRWGGRFKGGKDPMHFQAARGI